MSEVTAEVAFTESNLCVHIVQCSSCIVSIIRITLLEYKQFHVKTVDDGERQCSDGEIQMAAVCIGAFLFPDILASLSVIPPVSLHCKERSQESLNLFFFF